MRAILARRLGQSRRPRLGEALAAGRGGGGWAQTRSSAAPIRLVAAFEADATKGVAPDDVRPHHESGSKALDGGDRSCPLEEAGLAGGRWPVLRALILIDRI